MKTMIRRMMPLGLLIVFAVYGYSQNNSTGAATKQTKTTQTASTCGKFVDKNGDGICDIQKNCTQCKGKANCSGKNMQDCKTSCSGYDKAKCGNETKACCNKAGSGCCKDKGEGNACQHRQGSTNLTNTPDKTTTPTK
ncbi:MAG: hypothetical protein NTY96_04095 [Bacteroidetes bacterium]|nr:hypothetical protein [Bacteroidota bacterium]